MTLANGAGSEEIMDGMVEQCKMVMKDGFARLSSECWCWLRCYALPSGDGRAEGVGGEAVHCN